VRQRIEQVADQRGRDVTPPIIGMDYLSLDVSTELPIGDGTSKSHETLPVPSPHGNADALLDDDPQSLARESEREVGAEFETDQAIIAYVTDELKPAMPEGWVARQRLRYRSLGKPSAEVGLEDIEWQIARPEQSMRYPHHDYLVRVSGDRRTITVTPSNSDRASPGGGAVAEWPSLPVVWHLRRSEQATSRSTFPFGHRSIRLGTVRWAAASPPSTPRANDRSSRIVGS